jgi:threonyl-tRNA synthetase
MGALERFIGILIEHYAGAFPVWLSPIQVVIIPIASRHLRYGQSIIKKLKEENIRIKLDNRSETVQAKIRDAELEKIPFMLILGDKEMKKKKVSVRQRSKGNLGQMTLKKFVEKLNKEIEAKI